MSTYIQTKRTILRGAVHKENCVNKALRKVFETPRADVCAFSPRVMAVCEVWLENNQF
jgi:hypothetical protein